MQVYADWVRANSASARSVEQVLRTVVMLVSDVRSMVQFEAGIATANTLSFINSEILAEVQGFESDLQVAARRVHRVLCEFQCVVELALRRRSKLLHLNAAVVAIEAVKSLLILAMRWPNAKHQWRRAKAALLHRQPRASADEASPSGRPRRVVIPDVEVDVEEDAVVVTATYGVPAAVASVASWRDVARFVIDVTYLLRPVVVAWFALKYRNSIRARVARGAGLAASANVAKAVGMRGAWRVWLISLIVEVLLVIATHFVESNATPLVSALQPHQDGEDGEESSGSTLVSRRIRGLWSYLARDPFFGLYLEGLTRRWFVHSWFVNTVPLVGSLIAFQATNALNMQKQSYLYTAGGITATSTTAFQS